MSFPLEARQNRADLEGINLAAKKMHDYGTEVAHKSWMQVAHTSRRFRSAWSWKSKLSIRFAYFRTSRPPSWSWVSYGYWIELVRRQRCWSFAIIYCWSELGVGLVRTWSDLACGKGTYTIIMRATEQGNCHISAHEPPPWCKGKSEKINLICAIWYH